MGDAIDAMCYVFKQLANGEVTMRIQMWIWMDRLVGVVCMVALAALPGQTAVTALSSRAGDGGPAIQRDADGYKEKRLSAKVCLKYDPVKRFEVALPADSPMGEASIREHTIVWHPKKKKFYLVADVVSLSNPHHPNTYNTELYLWSSPDLTIWTLHGVAVPRGIPDESYDGYGAASPAGMAYYRGKLWVPFSARKTAKFARRSIGLAWSGDDPEQLPWTKSSAPVSDLEGEDDDPAVVVVDGDDRLHLYHRSTAGGYKIVHSASATPEQPDSWFKARPVTVRAADVRAQELTGVVCHQGWVHLFIIEHLNPRGMEIGHFASQDPGALFSYAAPSHRFVKVHPARLAYGGHLSPIINEGELVGLSWTVPQAGKRYGIGGYAAQWQSDERASVLPNGKKAE